MALRSPSNSTHSLDRDNRKESKMSARRLAATMWEINGLKSPKERGSTNEDFQGEDTKSLEKSGELLLNQSHSPLCKNKDGSNQGRHRRRSSSISQKLQLTDYIEQGMDSAINGSLEVTATASIKTRLKDISSSLAGTKEIVKALFRLWSQEGKSSSSLTLVSALRVEMDRARHEVNRLIDDEYNNEKAYKTLLKQFAVEKVAWKRKEKDRIFDAISSVTRELEIEKKLRRQSERLSKRLGKELADTKADLAKAMKKLDCERRAREILEQTYDELVKVPVEDTAEVEDEEKTAALERLRSDLEVYMGGKQSFDNASGNHDYGEGDSGDSDLNSIELSMDSLNRSYKWNFDKEDVSLQEQDDSVKISVDEVFKGRRSLSEHIQWENICLQRKTSDNIERAIMNNSNSKPEFKEA